MLDRFQRSRFDFVLFWLNFECIYTSQKAHKQEIVAVLLFWAWTQPCLGSISSLLGLYKIINRCALWGGKQVTEYWITDLWEGSYFCLPFPVCMCVVFKPSARHFVLNTMNCILLSFLNSSPQAFSKLFALACMFAPHLTWWMTALSLYMIAGESKMQDEHKVL